ncbi:RNA recognition motif domain-containing protein [Actinosynnema sp. NPDC004786]
MAGTKLYVSNLSVNTTVDTLRNTFSSCGQVTDCTIATDSAGVSRRYGNVTMSTAAEAQFAISTFNGSMLDSSRIGVTPAAKQ